jgi:hypothetical protein
LFSLCGKISQIFQNGKEKRKKEKKKLGLMNAYQSKRQPELRNIYKVVVHRSVHGTVDEVQPTVKGPINENNCF